MTKSFEFIRLRRAKTVMTGRNRLKISLNKAKNLRLSLKFSILYGLLFLYKR